MKSFSLHEKLLMVIIGLLLIGGTFLTGSQIFPSQSNTAIDSLPKTGDSIPLAQGSLNQPTDIQGAASGLQGAANVTPNQLNQLKLK